MNLNECLKEIENLQEGIVNMEIKLTRLENAVATKDISYLSGREKVIYSTGSILDIALCKDEISIMQKCIRSYKGKLSNLQDLKRSLQTK